MEAMGTRLDDHAEDTAQAVAEGQDRLRSEAISESDVRQVGPGIHHRHVIHRIGTATSSTASSGFEWPRTRLTWQEVFTWPGRQEAENELHTQVRMEAAARAQVAVVVGLASNNSAIVRLPHFSKHVVYPLDA
jgi:hypothetical protein